MKRIHIGTNIDLCELAIEQAILRYEDYFGMSHGFKLIASLEEEEACFKKVAASFRITGLKVDPRLGKWAWELHGCSGIIYSEEV